MQQFRLQQWMREWPIQFQDDYYNIDYYNITVAVDQPRESDETTFIDAVIPPIYWSLI